MAKPLLAGSHTFRDLIEGGFLYVDKTQDIYALIRYPKGIYFLSRPRRFGKSLTISMLHEIFKGNKELFRGLWLYTSDYAWQPYPVIRLDFSKERVVNAVGMADSIKSYLRDIANEYGIVLEEGPYERQFRWLIQQLATTGDVHRNPTGKVVILIDEYDKPLIENLENLAEAVQIRNTLKAFYGVIKAMDEYVRFVLITGISKFSRVGIFSDLNNLSDLTMRPDFATTLGITEIELRTDFAEHLAAFAEQQNSTFEDLLQKIRTWYNGFCFAGGAESVYNPFSTLSLLEQRRFSNFWFETGTPTFLIKLIKERGYTVQELNRTVVSELDFSTYELDNLAITPLLFQTGYLTIKTYDPTKQLYTLAYPNYEVENAFTTYLLIAFSQVELGLTTGPLWQLIDTLRANDLDAFFAVLKLFFANIPYTLQIKREKYYQTVFYLIFTLIGLRTHAEVTTNRGRIDAVVEVDEAIYLFEFKLNGNEQDALAQIKTMEYYERYQDWQKNRGKPVHLVGVNFSSRKRGVAGWCVETMAV